MISIIIPTFNNRKELQITLPALYDAVKAVMDSVGCEVEIILSDDGSTDGTQTWVEAEYPEINYFCHANLGRGPNRNFGAAQANGDYLLFLDSDVEVEMYAIEHLLAPIWNNLGDICFGKIRLVIGNRPSPLAHYLSQKWEKLMCRFSETLDPWDGYSGFFLLSKNLFDQMQGFSSQFNQYGGEDTDFFVRSSSAGARFIFAKNAVGWHHQALDLVSNLRRTYLSKYSASVIPGFKLDTELDHSAFNKTIKDQILYFIIHHNLWSKLKPLHYFLNKLKPKNKLARYFYHYLFLEYAKRGYREGVLKKWL